ncbi:MAG: phosphoribosylglycinamide formyltransferase [Atribacterota bacterium]|nr:phosphoribosylglycinamide formyltransferase [Atribacterota bacterium]
MIKIAVLVSGRGTNLQAIINAIKKGRIDGEIQVVISDNPKARALKRALCENIPAIVVPFKQYNNKEIYENELLNNLKKFQLDLIVLAGYMRLLGPDIIKQYHYRIINVHPALLPAFPGLHAQRQALNYGVKISGCTVHFVDEGIDSGSIILQKAVKIKQGDTEETLSRRISRYEHQILPQAIQLFAQNKITIQNKKTYITY